MPVGMGVVGRPSAVGSDLLDCDSHESQIKVKIDLTPSLWEHLEGNGLDWAADGNPESAAPVMTLIVPG